MILRCYYDQSQAVAIAKDQSWVVYMTVVFTVILSVCICHGVYTTQKAPVDATTCICATTAAGCCCTDGSETEKPDVYYYCIFFIDYICLLIIYQSQNV